MVMLFNRLLFFRCQRFEFHTGTISQISQRFAEVPSFFLHHEAEDIPTFITLTKTTPGTCLRENNKSWSAGIAVKGAKTSIVFSRPAQLDCLGNQIYDINATFDLIYSGHYQPDFCL